MRDNGQPAEIQCPFYRRHDAKFRLTCEGILGDSTLQLIFKRKEDFRQQLELFCSKDYKKCEIYRMLMENKYDEGD